MPFLKLLLSGQASKLRKKGQKKRFMLTQINKPDYTLVLNKKKSYAGI